MAMKEGLEAFKMLEQIARKHGGYLPAREAVSQGISRSTLDRFIWERRFERMADGIYLAPEAMDDEYYLLQLQYPELILSHNSALFMNDLSDYIPRMPEVTASAGFDTRKLEQEGVQVHTVAPELHELGLTQTKTMFGNSVRVYDLERTICDVLRDRDAFEAQEYYGAFKYYIRHPDKKLWQLDQYAQKFGVRDTANEYMRLLLA